MKPGNGNRNGVGSGRGNGGGGRERGGGRNVASGTGIGHVWARKTFFSDRRARFFSFLLWLAVCSLQLVV